MLHHLKTPGASERARTEKRGRQREDWNKMFRVLVRAFNPATHTFSPSLFIWGEQRSTTLCAGFTKNNDAIALARDTGKTKKTHIKKFKA